MSTHKKKKIEKLEKMRGKRLGASTVNSVTIKLRKKIMG